MCTNVYAKKTLLWKRAGYFGTYNLFKIELLQQTTLFNNIIGLYILYFGMYFKIYSKEVTMYVWCEHMVLCTYTVIESIDLSQFSGCKSDGVVALCFK